MKLAHLTTYLIGLAISTPTKPPTIPSALNPRDQEFLPIEVFSLRDCDPAGTSASYSVDGYFTQIIIPESGAFKLGRRLLQGEMLDFSGQRCDPWISSWDLLERFFRSTNGTSDSVYGGDGPVPETCYNVDSISRDGGAGCFEVKLFTGGAACEHPNPEGGC